MLVNRLYVLGTVVGVAYHAKQINIPDYICPLSNQFFRGNHWRFRLVPNGR